MESLWVVITIWLALGVHSAWFLKKRYTYHYDMTVSEIPMFIFCIVAPIATHIATFLIYPKPQKQTKTIFKKRG